VRGSLASLLLSFFLGWFLVARFLLVVYDMVGGNGIGRDGEWDM
jgi:hypothetical protein